MNFQERLRGVAKLKILYLPHAITQMSHPERMITTNEVERIIDKGEIIEDYPDDSRGHSCLMLGHGMDNRPVHIVCSPKEKFLAVITAYLPNNTDWVDNFRKRR
jgi:hypothetical protein